jgi:hypothetical protein
MRSHSSRRPPSRSLGGLLTRREGPSCSTGYHQRSKNLSPVAKPHLSCWQPCSSRASSIAAFDDGVRRGRRQRVPRWSAWRRRALRKGLVRLARRTNGPLVRVRKGPRKPLAPPGAPSPCEKGKGNREAGHPGPEKQTTGAAQRWLNRLFENRICCARDLSRNVRQTRFTLPWWGRVASKASGVGWALSQPKRFIPLRHLAGARRRPSRGG